MVKQLIQDLGSGETSIIDVPIPAIKPGHVLIDSRFSLISPGTERMLIEFGKSNLIKKVQQQPEKVQQVLDKISTDGLFPTLNSVQSKLNTPIVLGYSNVGIVSAIGEGVKEFKIGDRVISNGYHSEVVSVPENLAAKIPDNVSDEDAAYTVIASIGLQSIRLANPTFGECFLVIGLGLVGILTAQLLLANGIKVFAYDLDITKCLLAESLGIQVLKNPKQIDPVEWVMGQTQNIGVDGVIITASTKSNKPIDIAANSCRQRGRIVLVGVTGLNLNRDYFYKKEISFQVSCSYGPGRYDPSYELKNNDYPIGHVRWTVKRNFKAVLEALSIGSIKTDKLTTDIYDFSDSEKAFESLLVDNSTLGILLRYPFELESKSETISLKKLKEPIQILSKDQVVSVVGFIGTGNYARNILIPSLSCTDCKLYKISSNSGLGPVDLGRKHGFNYATSSTKEVIFDPKINTLVIATRHDSHSELILKCLTAGKNIFVEKPLCLTLKELDSIENLYNEKMNEYKLNKTNIMPILMVGYNRRFAPLIIKIKNVLLNIKAPKSFVYTVNAGKIDSNNWIQDRLVGGGRFIGEACHFVDLLRFLADSPIKNLELFYSREGNSKDTFSVQIIFDDGSIGTINYFSNGNKAFPKERLEVFTDGKIMQINNFRTINTWGVKIKNDLIKSQDKGQNACIKSFIDQVKKKGPAPIPINELFEVQRFLLAKNT